MLLPNCKQRWNRSVEERWIIREYLWELLLDIVRNRRKNAVVYSESHWPSNSLLPESLKSDGMSSSLCHWHWRINCGRISWRDLQIIWRPLRTSLTSLFFRNKEAKWLMKAFKLPTSAVFPQQVHVSVSSHVLLFSSPISRKKCLFSGVKFKTDTTPVPWLHPFLNPEDGSGVFFLQWPSFLPLCNFSLTSHKRKSNCTASKPPISLVIFGKCFEHLIRENTHIHTHTHTHTQVERTE